MNYLYLLTLLSLPFWSLSIIPGTYSALTPYLSAFIGVICSCKYILNKASKVNRTEVSLTFLLLSLLLFYSTYSIFNYGESVLIKLLSYPLAIFSFIGFYSLVINKGTFYIQKWLLRISYFVSILALLELLSRYSGLVIIKEVMNTLFSNGYSENLILTTSEPSWAVQLLLLCSFSIAIDFLKNRKLFALCFLFTNSIFFFSAFSLTGFVVLISSIFVYIVIFSKVSFLNITRWCIFLVLVTSFGYFTYSFGVQHLGGYTFNRIDKLINIFESDLGAIYMALISIDNSLLIRIGYPVVAINMIIDTPLGLGVGGFANNLKDYTHLLSVPGFWYSEVPQHIENLNADPRNFILSFGVDFGIAGIVFIAFLLTFLSRRLKASNSDCLFEIGIFSICIGMMLQFSTVYFSYYLLSFAMAIHKKETYNLEKK